MKKLIVLIAFALATAVTPAIAGKGSKCESCCKEKKCSECCGDKCAECCK